MEGTREAGFSLSNMIVLGQLGRGGTSHVFRAQSTRSKRLYAMKVIDKRARNYHRPALERELAIHLRLSHSSVVRLEGHIEDSDNHYVLTEYCEGGEMTRLLSEQLSEETLASVMWQVAVGLSYLHAEGVAHCDLKLSNLLLQRGQIKICDFGFSQSITEDISDQRPVCGTVYYMAPEILKEKRRVYHKEGDVWALGICLLILITKKSPYSGETFQQLRKQIIAGERQNIPPVTPELEDLLTKLLQMNPKARITLQGVLAHPFLIKHSSQLQQTITLKSVPPRQKKISKVEEVTNLVSESESEQPETPQKQQETPVQAEKEKQWSFKRTSKKEESSHDNTLERRMTRGNISDNEKTVRQSKKKETPIHNQKSVNQDNHELAAPTYNPIIDARLIKPFEEFHYQTKNDGFIHIASDGTLSIRVKNINFQITSDGEILRLNNQDIKIKEIQTKPATSKKPNQLYSYARDVIKLLKEKQYAATWKECHGDSELLLAISLDWTSVRCICSSKESNTLIQWTKGKDDCGVWVQGEKLVKKGIGQLAEDQLFVLNVMKAHLCPLEKHQQ